MNNDVMELIEMLYTQVSEAWGVPLGNEKCIVERDKVLGLLHLEVISAVSLNTTCKDMVFPALFPEKNHRVVPQVEIRIIRP